MIIFNNGSAFIHFVNQRWNRQRDFNGSAGGRKMLRRLSRQKHACKLKSIQTLQMMAGFIHFLVWQEVVADCIFGPVARIVKTPKQGCRMK
jgi:hypothetical protein